MVALRTFALAAVLVAAPSAAAAPVPCLLAKGGTPLQRVVVGAKATDRTRAAAKTLATYLGRITGGTFAVAEGDGDAGLAVGRPDDFPKLKLAAAFDAADVSRREEYLLRSHADGVWLVGATDLAVEHAVWDTLYRLGYRQYLPGKNWEIVPAQRDLTLAVDAREKPAYHARRIWYGFGPADYATVPYAEWCAKNRATSGIALNSGHAYGGIIARNKQAFADHPEYLGLVGGERKSSKFCISNPALRKLVAADALAQFAKEPARDSVSVDPSDGGGWCECAECKKIGSVTDRALTLANEVAAAVQAKYPGRLVGMYAYSEHSPPPSISAHPNVVVSVATGFIRGGYTIDQLLDGWSKKATTLGVREYYSVNTWDRDLPGAARGGRLGYLTRTIPHFRAKGVRFMSAESSDNWGPNGLGYFVAARLLWDVAEADKADALVADFLTNCFGEANGPMGEFYALLTADRAPLLCDDTVGRMYRLLADARAKTTDAAVLARLDDLTGYVRYVELWLDYSAATGAARQAAFEALIRHAWRIRTSEMVHTKALYRDLPARDKSVTVPTDAKWNATKANPWKADPPLTRAEYVALTAAGIAGRKLLDFMPVSYTDELVPATPLKLPEAKPGSAGIYSRGTRTYFTWVEKEPATLAFTAKGGLIYNSRGPAKIDLYPVAEPEGKAVAHAEVPPDKAEHPVGLKTTFTGLHRVEVTDGGAGTLVTWADGTPMTLRSGADAPTILQGRWNMYFYVPKGTKVVGGFASGPGNLLDGAGKKVHTFDDKKAGYFSIPVPAGHDGKLWMFTHTAGRRLLMTVPPYLARSPRELLLPAEVVKADAPR